MNYSLSDGRIRLSQSFSTARGLFPGVLASATVAMAATFLSSHYQAPVMLFALLLGMAFHFLSDHGPCREGVEFAAKPVLRVGVALLGARITFEQIAALGIAPVVTVVLSVFLTIFLGVLLARRLGLSTSFGVLSGGAVAICGASAALALAAVLPQSRNGERDTIFVVISVTTLSTVAMIIYPLIAKALGLDEVTAGLFIGATIHDVAQVVGAGYSLSETTGDVSTYIKLLRVSMLVPIVAGLALLSGLRASGDAGAGKAKVPLFLVGFVALAAVNSTGAIPRSVVDLLADVSSWCLVSAIAAIGMKTSLRSIATVGVVPVTLVVVETVWLAAVVFALLWVLN